MSEYRAPDLSRVRLARSHRIFRPVRTCALCGGPHTEERVSLENYDRLVCGLEVGNTAARFVLTKIRALPGHINSPVCRSCALGLPVGELRLYL